jgi:hypothetical protein
MHAAGMYLLVQRDDTDTHRRSLWQWIATLASAVTVKYVRLGILMGKFPRQEHFLPSSSML